MKTVNCMMENKENQNDYYPNPVWSDAAAWIKIALEVDYFRRNGKLPEENSEASSRREAQTIEVFQKASKKRSMR